MSSLIVNRHALPAEALRGISFATFWAGSSYYVSHTSSKELSATMLGILNGVYNGLGQSVGSLLGGMLSKKYGIAMTFKISAMANAIVLFSFSLQQLYVNINSKRQQDKIIQDKTK